jgi:succinate dehydrogenase flavin-adding protein (antitoxin of CptAB toxin-antitoxin module)
MNQTQKNIFIKKLLYQSKNRGCKETDLILGKFANRFLLDADKESLRDFAMILEQDDTDIYDWVTQKILPPPHLDSKVMQSLLKFNINKDND